MSESRRVVITGASSGLGKALAIEYARRGASLALIARRGDLLERLAETLPVCTYTYAVDVSNASALAAAGEDILSRMGTPDVVIANAGISAGTDPANPADNAVFDKILAVNLTGLMLTFQMFMDTLRAARRGSLVGIASVAGFRGLPGVSAYSASKAAAISYLESLRLELRGSGVRVTTVCPGFIATPMTAGNPYRMPFLLDAQPAAKKIADAVARGRSFYVLPWQMAAVGWVLRRLPRPLYDLAFERAPRKPRQV